MADVRAMLRGEREQRRIKHPQATYTATGTLECTVCHIPLKSDQEVWNKHLKSTQHLMRQERLRLNTIKPSEPTTARVISTRSKKRKADDGEDNSRKKTRPAIDVPGESFDEDPEPNGAHRAENATSMPEPKPKPEPEPEQTATLKHESTPSTLPSHPTPPPKSTSQPTIKEDINEDEWAAFERDVATPPPDPTLPSALTATATITAAPLTAAELAAQSREQASQQAKEKRETEVEGEKEDAARALEEEFDEMEGLEERVGRLRRMREELRNRRIEVVDNNDDGDDEDEDGGYRETSSEAMARRRGGWGSEESGDEGAAGGGEGKGDGDEEDYESDSGEDLYGFGALGRG